MTPEEEYLEGILAGPSDEDKQYARGMGALMGGLGILRNRRDIPGALMGGLATYSNQLESAEKASKARLTTAMQAKKLVADQLKMRGYEDYITDDGIDTIGLARAASRNRDSNTFSQALALHNKNDGKKPTFVPPKTKYVLKDGKAVKIEGIPEGDDEEKLSSNERQIQELMDRGGYDRRTAEAMVYNPYRQQTSPDGGISLIDTRQIHGPLPPLPQRPMGPMPPPGMPPQAGPPGVPPSPPGMGIAAPGTPDAPYAPGEAPGPMPGPPMGPQMQPPGPVPGMPAPRQMGPMPQPGVPPGMPVNRFAPTPPPPGAVISMPGTRGAAQLDAAVKDFQTAFTKTGIEQVQEIFEEIDSELTKYGYVYDQNADGGKGSYVLAPGAKRKDVPGLGMTGNMPQFLLTDEGRAISGPVQAIINQRLYDLSGKAVTKNEMERQLKAMQATAFLSDTDTLRGLGRVRRGYEKTREQILSGANPIVLQEFENRRKAFLRDRGPEAPGAEAEITVDEMGYELGPDGKKTGRRFDTKTGARIL